ncbi:hypothetical protein IMW82_13435 [Rhodanobacter sp. B2A1Ga4]|uniref:hypothetical protein n=1 Tax=Rhodanobacter sp. B2A1Ga4 TaxID=2778647 RepID=UPI001B379F33|nr:hypothetical protein [Rhodanobacter sp. B2A1Ga4]MBQ4855675.1 hypothetical protein [Rhodanobacter sp. B2A1Ga4]
MSKLTTIIRALWKHHGFESLVAIGFLLTGVDGLITGVAMFLHPPAQLPGIEPLVGPEFLVAGGLFGVIICAVVLFKNVRTELEVLRFNASSHEEQNAVLARELGLPVSKILAMRPRKNP